MRDEHSKKLELIQKSLSSQKNCDIYRGSAHSNALRNRTYKRKNSTPFNKILEINCSERWISVEPRVTFAELCRYTVAHGLIPPVVPEFTSITVGGAVMGAALESSSHRYGQVSDNCLEFELILGNGELLYASPEKNSDLFYGISGSYGTLAILTAIKLRLIEAKKWVHLSYRHFSDLNQAVSTLTSPQKCDFIEGIVFSRHHTVVIKGEMSDEINAPLWRQNHPWSEWYVQHVAKNEKTEEAMPLVEYLFRLDRAAFWMGSYVHSFKTMVQLLFHFGIPKIKKHSLDPDFLFRFLFGWTLSSKRLYQVWHRIPNEISERLFFIHDFYTPFPNAVKTLKHFLDETEIFPVWLCPIKGTHTGQFLSPHFGHDRLLNIGLYGVPKHAESIPLLSAKLEKEIVQYGGRKMLYSFTYYDKELFSRIYHESEYVKLRKKFCAENAFTSLYNKVVK